MAMAGLGHACRNHSPFLSALFYGVSKVRRCSAAAVEKLAEYNIDDNRKAPAWKRLNSKDLGISASMIAKPTRVILNELRNKGYDAYLVGGCVRDLILKRTPKDFDIITSAELQEVMSIFSQCVIVGKRFPICHVHISDEIVEVSSFRTSGRRSIGDLSYNSRRPTCCDEHDDVRRRNCLQRDFTINGLMFDPYANLVYDYMEGLEDIRKAKVRTVIPASISFQEDCARILRAVRIAARLSFRFTREIARSVRDLSCSVLRLDKGRLLMEVNYMLAYGSAEASLRLLWKFGLLDILLPIQASYFASQGFRRRDKRSNMLLSLFSNLDKLLAPDRPCHSSLWVGVLAFHRALFDHPRDPLVVAAFSLAMHSNGDLVEAINIARKISRPHDRSFPELALNENLETDEALMNELADFALSVKATLSKLTDEYCVSQAMSKYAQAPYSDLVFIPLALYLKVCRVFECVRGGKEKGFIPKQGSNIDYELLALGSLSEIRHMFARVVFDTIYPLNLIESQSST